MGFFKKLAGMINGTAPGQGALPKQDDSLSSDNQAHSNAPESQLNKKNDGSSDAIPSDKPIVPAPAQAPNKGAHSVAESDKALLRSKSISEQRYAWHKYLIVLLSSINAEKSDSLKHFTIYIKKCETEYKWNDAAFKAELLQALHQLNLKHIGAASLTLEIVSSNNFKHIAQKQISDAQFLKIFDEIILFGSPRKTHEQKFATAIDKRAYIISEFLKKFRHSAGTDSSLVENLTIIVVRNDDDDDMTQYDWLGKKFEDDLKRELTNAFLDKIGSKYLQVILKPKAATTGCLCLIENQIYYQWGKQNKVFTDAEDKQNSERVLASVSILEGTGSMIKSTYQLDSDKKKLFHIGRGVSSRKAGKYRINDIVINDNETDPALLNCNAHVSSSHADILFKNNKYYIKASSGGCRATGGSPTKIIRDEIATELRDTSLLYPLCDGDIIELGKNLLLTFSISDNQPNKQ